ncbi:MAG: Gfo/Idh/MocA family oxidoreductase [Kiritimatiellae bacterium]|nr:Gfo/Idh/MocA family oxidoreductase [Kiritimatiellia bacterium]
MKKKPLRAIYHGLRHEHAPGKLETLAKLRDDFEIVAAVDDLASTTPTWHAEPPTGAGFRLVSAKEALAMPDIDVVFVETANGDLIDAAMPWAERGVALHLDKPTGETREPFRRIVELCRSRNVPLQMGYMFRCNPAVQFCQQVVRDGVLGEIVHAEADMNFNAWDPAYAEYISSFKAGVFYNLACHDIDLLVPMMKGDLVRATLSVGDAPGDPPGSRTRCAAMLEWPESTAFLRVCSHVPQGMRRRLRVEGSNGTLELQPIECFSGKPLKVVLHLAKAAGPYVAGLHEFEFGPQTDRYAGLFLELAAIVRGEKPNPVELYDHDLKVHDTCLRACGLNS